MSQKFVFFLVVIRLWHFVDYIFQLDWKSLQFLIWGMVVFKKDDMEKKNNDEFDIEMGGVSLGGVSKPWSLATPF